MSSLTQSAQGKIFERALFHCRAPRRLTVFISWILTDLLVLTARVPSQVDAPLRQTCSRFRRSWTAASRAYARQPLYYRLSLPAAVWD